MTDEQPVRFELRTQSTLSSSGDAIAREPGGRVVFVQGAAPDELVEVEVLKSRKSFVRATVSRVIEPSPDRVEPPCAHFGVCGGCVSQHVSAAAQTRSKVAALQDALTRIGKLDTADLTQDEAWSGQEYGYRARSRFSVAPKGVIGFRRRGGRKVADVKACPVLVPALQEALTALRTQIGKVSKVDEVDAIAVGDRAQLRLPNRLSRAVKTWTGPVELLRGRTRRTLEVDDGHGRLLVAPGVFAQSNPAGNAALVEYVAQLLTAESPFNSESLISLIVELYAGSGNLTRRLVGLSDRVHAIEGAEDAVRLARQVLPEGVEWAQTSVEEGLVQLLEAGATGAVVVANPPRTGLSSEVVDGLGRLAPEALVYVSCDPATFSRDASRLSEQGLRLDRIRVFDLYPQTAHVELVARFVRS